MLISTVVKKVKEFTFSARSAGKNDNASWDARPQGVGYRVQGEINNKYTLIFDLPYGSEEPVVGELMDYEVSDYLTLTDALNAPVKVKTIQEPF